ncbi:DUF1491 family protein [Pararhizobium sp. IMCC21322]|uniref:DUF1491 family protein n=1 Tax=Pararhizobium sp. IMCC21322 TaxID=3067903 RepID=UPI00274099EF|nr:DUF1491 family protein [Pararhizobium sp. IMCC21322]
MVRRLSSDLWVASYLRQCRLNGSFGYLAKRGATDAGAIFVKIVEPDGSVNLYGPAPQSEFLNSPNEDDFSGEDSRIFELVLVSTEEQIEARLSSEKNFDPDIWVVEVENATGNHALRLVE